jgi:hypothetical protein
MILSWDLNVQFDLPGFLQHITDFCDLNGKSCVAHAHALYDRTWRKLLQGNCANLEKSIGQFIAQFKRQLVSRDPASGKLRVEWVIIDVPRSPLANLEREITSKGSAQFIHNASYQDKIELWYAGILPSSTYDSHASP